MRKACWTLYISVWLGIGYGVSFPHLLPTSVNSLFPGKPINIQAFPILFVQFAAHDHVIKNKLYESYRNKILLNMPECKIGLREWKFVYIVNEPMTSLLICFTIVIE